MAKPTQAQIDAWEAKSPHHKGLGALAAIDPGAAAREVERRKSASRTAPMGEGPKVTHVRVREGKTLPIKAAMVRTKRPPIAGPLGVLMGRAVPIKGPVPPGGGAAPMAPAVKPPPPISPPGGFAARFMGPPAPPSDEEVLSELKEFGPTDAEVEDLVRRGVPPERIGRLIHELEVATGIGHEELVRRMKALGIGELAAQILAGSFEQNQAAAMRARAKEDPEGAKRRGFWLSPGELGDLAEGRLSESDADAIAASRGWGKGSAYGGTGYYGEDR